MANVKRGRPAEFRLTDEGRDELVRARKDAKACNDWGLMNRAKALLLIANGLTREQAAVACDVKVRAVYRWQRAYEGSGVDGLRTKPKPGAPWRLDEQQRADLVEVVTAGPEAAGLDTGMWTSPIIADLIEKRYGVKYSPSRVRAMLPQLGFSVQYPRVRLSRANEEAQQKWVEEELPKIEERVKDEGGTLFFRTNAASNSPGRSDGRGRRLE